MWKDALLVIFQGKRLISFQEEHLWKSCTHDVVAWMSISALSWLLSSITLALAAVAGVMMGLTVSAFAPNDDSANSLLPIIIIPQVIFAGAVIPLKDWLTWLVAALFPTRWAMAALGSTIGLHSDKIDGGKLFGNDYVYHSTLFSIYTQSDATQRIVVSWIALGAIIIILTCLIGVLLKRKDVRL